MDRAAPPVPQSFPSRIQGGSDSTDDYHLLPHGYDSTKGNNPGATAATSSSTSPQFRQSDRRGNEASSQDEDWGKGKAESKSIGPPPIRRRNRNIKSCLECRRRKLKCDQRHPCSNCARFKRDCIFVAPAVDSKSKMKLAELKERMGSLERILAHDVAGSGFGFGLHEGRSVEREKGKETVGYEEYRSYEGGAVGSSHGRGDDIAGEERYEDSPVSDGEALLEPTQMVSQDAAYEDEADDDDDRLDLGFRIGKLRMTDRIGGLFRPRVNEEIAQALNNLRLTSPDEEEDVPEKPSQPSPRLRDLLSADKESYFKPGASYIAANSDLLFGAESVRKHTLREVLPERSAVDILMQRYWESVHTIAKVVHRPSLEKRYDSFWEVVSSGDDPPPSLQAVVFAAMLSAVTSMSETLALSTFGAPQKDLIKQFQLGTERALGKAHFLKTTKTETLQGLVMYLIPMCRSEISRAHSTLVGAAIRLAECMGFHRDPSEYDLPPVETHVRRMIWYQLCFLDLRTSEIQGPRPTIHSKDFSTRYPLNVDDSELQQSTPTSLRDMPRWTDMTFTRIRMEGCEFHRVIYDENARLVRKDVSVTSVLGKIESFRKKFYAKYQPFINCPDQKPVHKACGLVLVTIIARLYVIVLHRYLIGVSIRIPDRLRQLLLSAAIQQLENSIILETSPELQNWSWYVGSFQQYHPAILLLIEITMYPMRKEAHRIWKCLDIIYEVPSLPPRSGTEADRDITLKELIAYRHRKGVFILTQLRDRMSSYRDLRKPKIPVRMRDKRIYVGRSASGMGGDLMASKPEDVQSAEGARTTASGQSAEKAKTTASGIEVQASSPQVPEISSGNAILPPKTVFLSSSSNPSCPTQPTQTSQPSVLQHQAPTQPHVYPESQNQPPHQYQPQVQSNLQFDPLWQQQSQYPGSLASGLGYGAIPATQPTAYGQTPVYGSSDTGQSIESGTENLEGLDVFGLWSNMETPGAGTAPTVPPHTIPPPEDQPMIDIDWDEWDKLYPPEINTGDINMPMQSTEGQPIPMDTSFDNFLFPNAAYFQTQ